MPDKPAEDRLSARELILTLMDSASSASLSASYLVTAAGLFGMDPGNVRVALARLVRDGSLHLEARGRYRLGTRAGTLNALVRNWSRAEESLLPWTGGWLSVFVGHLARGNKTRVRGNERALSLYGFAESQPGFWIRPANLKQSLGEIRDALTRLGLDESSLAAEIARLAPPDAVRPGRLWEIRRLESRYRSNVQALKRSRARLARLNEAAGARETLLVGRRVTRDILLDPLLPEELVDAALRRRMIDAMRDYDRIGRGYWRAIYARHGDQKPAA